jgi:hypothetical protein
MRFVKKEMAYGSATFFLLLNCLAGQRGLRSKVNINIKDMAGKNEDQHREKENDLAEK